MPYIRLIEPDDATGAVAREYGDAFERAGKVFNIVKAMSPNAGVMRSSMQLYVAIMRGPSELSRIERELLAVVVSRENDCHY
jgi:alkylhydroperoxidase family enzyme